MGNWWPAKGRGLIFGLWTCHQYIGDIVAALAAGILLHGGFDYRWYSAEPYPYQCHIDFITNININSAVSFITLSSPIDYLCNAKSSSNNFIAFQIEWHDRCLIIPAVLNGIWAFINFTKVPSTPEEFGLVKKNFNDWLSSYYFWLLNGSMITHIFCHK